MAFGIVRLLVCLLTVVSIGNSVHAISCHKCDNCPDAAVLREPENCNESTVWQSLLKILEKEPPLEDNEMRQAKLNDKNTESLVSCFKVSDNKTAHRGCGGPINREKCIMVYGDVMSCGCEEDGCNSGSTLFAPIALIGCLSIVSVFLSI